MIIFGILGIVVLICGIALYGKTCGHGSTLVEAECIDVVDGYPVYHYEFLEKEYTSSPGFMGRSKKNPTQPGPCHIFINGRVPTTIYSYGLRKVAVIIGIVGLAILIFPIIVTVGLSIFFVSFLFNMLPG